MLHGARRYARLFRVFARTCLIKEMEFRGSFWAGVFIGIIWVSTYLAVAQIIYANTDSVAGWNKGQMVLLLGTYTLSLSIIGVFFSGNLAQLPGQVRMGTFDFVLIKPVNSQFFISLRYMNFGEIGTMASAIVLTLYGAALADIHVTLVGLLLYVVLLACGVTIFYAIYLMMMTTAFWFIRVDNLWALAETVHGVARTPINIFGPSARKFFTFVLPLIFVAHIPAQTLFRAPNWPDVGLAMVMCVVLLFVSSRFWTFATRFYASASS